MKFLVAFIALAVVASADLFCTYEAPKRDCAWNVDVTLAYQYSGSDRLGDSWSTWQRATYYFNGRFMAKRVKNYDGAVVSREIYRPDLNALFTYDGTQCRKSIKSEKVYKIENFYDVVDLFDSEDEMIIKAITGNSTWYSCGEDAKYDGKSVKKYSTLLDALVLYVNKKNDEPIALQEKIFDGRREDGDVLGVLTYEFDFGTKAFMSDFSFSKREIYKCPDERIYDTPSDDYAYCAAFTTKAGLSVVLAAIVIALLSIF